MFKTILYQFAIISQLSFALQYLNMHICDTFTELNFELRAMCKGYSKNDEP